MSSLRLADIPDESAATKHGLHERVQEYDGAFRCLDCKAQWGALPGSPSAPARCTAATDRLPPGVRTASEPRDDRSEVAQVEASIREKRAVLAKRLNELHRELFTVSMADQRLKNSLSALLGASTDEET